MTDQGWEKSAPFVPELLYWDRTGEKFNHHRRHHRRTISCTLCVDGQQCSIILGAIKTDIVLLISTLFNPYEISHVISRYTLLILFQYFLSLFPTHPVVQYRLFEYYVESLPQWISLFTWTTFPYYFR